MAKWGGEEIISQHVVGIRDRPGHLGRPHIRFRKKPRRIRLVNVRKPFTGGATLEGGDEDDLLVLPGAVPVVHVVIALCDVSEDPALPPAGVTTYIVVCKNDDGVFLGREFFEGKAGRGRRHVGRQRMAYIVRLGEIRRGHRRVDAERGDGLASVV